MSIYEEDSSLQQLDFKEAASNGKHLLNYKDARCGAGGSPPLAAGPVPAGHAPLGGEELASPAPLSGSRGVGVGGALTPLCSTRHRSSAEPGRWELRRGCPT